MMIEEEFPDLSDLLREKVITRYVAASLIGFVQENKIEFERAAAVACRLIDKAVSDYEDARHILMSEVREGKDVNSTVNIANSLEDCINAVERINKLRDSLVVSLTNNRHLTWVRNAIAHPEERIKYPGPLVPWVENGVFKFINIDGEVMSLEISVLADRIRYLHKEILSIFL